MTVKFVDLFAGIGGIRLGIEQASKDIGVDVECVFSSEWDTFACKTYKANFGEIPAGDITKIPTKEIPDHDLLCGGFPCQPFSLAGKKLGFEDVRGTLFFEIARVLQDKKPFSVFLENVKNLKGHNNGQTLARVLSILKELGYFGKYTVLSSRGFGVPQNRQRLYIVGFLSENTANGFEFPSPHLNTGQVGDILDENIDEKYYISQKLWISAQERKKRNQDAGKGFGYQLFNPTSPYTATLSARYYKDGSEILINIEGKKTPRRLTPRECARLQGFPEDFIIPVSDCQAYKQFGNSVSVPVIRAIMRNLLNK